MMAYFLGGLGGGALLAIGLYFWMIGRYKRIPSLTKYVVFSLAVLIIYYIAEFIVSTKTGIEHSTLSTCITGVLGGEVLSCALIRIFKLKEENNE